jgi:homoserine kinase
VCCDGGADQKRQIFNLQRLAVLTTALTRSPPDADLIYQAMQDKVHQPYRKTLVGSFSYSRRGVFLLINFTQIPGLPEILASVTPRTHRGLLGICLSGAGPTILALATENFEAIADEILERFKQKNITCVWKLLVPAHEGATVTYS